MRILYVASDQRVPGRTGGSVHVAEVASGLAALGHEVHVVALAGDGPRPTDFTLHPSRMWLDHRALRWSARGQVERLVEELGVDAVMERYYNFGGEGVRAAHAKGVPTLLEVNSPLKEPEGSLKSRLDRWLLLRPMERLRDEICAKTDAFVSPLPSIVPDVVPRAKVHRVNWGANVEKFCPDGPRAPLPLDPDRAVVVFSGSFRPWHGADVLVRAAAEIPGAQFLFVGDGPSRGECESLAKEEGLGARAHFTGAVAYDEMPGYLRWAAVGVAPYQPSRLRQMQLGFYWSPLKVFEYMATGVAVISLDVAPLREIVEPEQGALVPEGSPTKLAEAIRSLLGDEARLAAMGRAGRERVVSTFSWRKHCEDLDRVLKGIVGR